MKKATTLFAAILLLAVGATAQKLSYQAVVRNNANELVTETTVQVAVTVLNANNAVQYAETHANVQTNRNGLLSLMIGDGVPTGSATLAGVEWPGASLRTVITLPDNTTITNVTPVNSVPYALYADNVNPDMVSDAIADYIASHNIGGEDNVQADWNETDQGSDAYIRNKPDIPTVPTDISAFANDAGYLTEAQCNGVDICSLLNMMAALQQQVDNVQDQNTNLQHRLDSLQTVVDTMNGIFVCGVSTVTDHEGNIYHTVQIGNQCWTKENLRTTTSPTTGTYLIPAAGTGHTYTGKQARWYNNDSATYAPMNYGLLYNWNAAVDTFNTAYGETSVVNNSSSNAVSVSVTFNGHRRGICPVGWHLPSDAEWTAMTDYVSSQSEFVCGGNTSYIAKALADSLGWYSETNTCAVGNDQTSNNALGFGAVPAGSCNGSSFVGAGYNAYFWSATQTSSSIAYDRNLHYSIADVNRTYDIKDDGFSVRCLRDNIPTGDTPTPQDTTVTPSDTTITPTDTTNTSYGIPCPGTPIVTDHEGNVYNTVQIGDQCWMRDNLRTTTSPTTGTYLIPASGTGSTYTGKQAFWYNNDSATYAPQNYGLLYNWNAAVDTFNTAYGETSVNTDYNNAVSVAFSGHRRGICPVGWHLPSNAEWDMMEATVSGSDWQTSYETTDDYRGSHAGKLAGGDNWTSSITSGAPGDYSNAERNVSGFSAVPAGHCVGSSFFDAGDYASFWSASQYASTPANAYNRALYYSIVGVYWYDDIKNFGSSVRCLRDSIPSGGDTPLPQDTTNTPVDTTTTSGIPCPGMPTVTDHEGNVYATVQIGDQCWMKENLRTTTSPSTGTYLIPTAGTGYTYTGKQAFWFDNDSTTYAPMNYGLLYNWNAAVDTFNTAYGETSVNTSESNAVSVAFSGHRRGICPVGWHLPSDAEWTALTNYVGSVPEYQCDGNSNSIAKALASTRGWVETTDCYDYDINQMLVSCCPGGDQSATVNNASGFGAVPAGGCYIGFYGAGIGANFWSSSEYGSNYAWDRNLYFNCAYVYRDTGDYKYFGYSVRCLRDSIPSGDTPVPQDTTTTSGIPCSGTPTVTDHEGNVYNTVQIGDQCWTKENLRTTTSPSTGTYLIPTAGTGYTYTGKQAFWFDNDSTTYAPMNYGLLYNWNAAVDTFNTAYGETSVNTSESNAVSVAFSGHRRGICPVGWHLPSDAEWTALTNYVGSVPEYQCDGNSNSIAKALASTTGWYYDYEECGSCSVAIDQSVNNATGFSAVPAGYCYGSSFYSAGLSANFWSATQDFSSLAYRRYLSYNSADVDRGNDSKSIVYSVRCLRD